MDYEMNIKDSLKRRTYSKADAEMIDSMKSMFDSITEESISAFLKKKRKEAQESIKVF